MSSPSNPFQSVQDEKYVHLRSVLRKHGVICENLAVLFLSGAEQYLGELLHHPCSPQDGSPLPIAGRLVEVTNPKRFMRIQSMSPQGMSIQFMLGDLDMMESGALELVPLGGYWLTKTDLTCQVGMLELYAAYLQQKSAEKSGISLPGNSKIVTKR